MSTATAPGDGASLTGSRFVGHRDAFSASVGRQSRVSVQKS
jgi:hypothetical protein